MIEQNSYPPTKSNEITKEYYYSLLDQINRGTCTKKVTKVLIKNGTHEYHTYHLTSTI